jgi:hypothetical protein
MVEAGSSVARAPSPIGGAASSSLRASRPAKPFVERPEKPATRSRP